MAASERFEVLILGSGAGGKLLAWDMARSGRRTAVVERQWIGGSCRDGKCMPPKKENSSAHPPHPARPAPPARTQIRRGAIGQGTGCPRKTDNVHRHVAA